MKKASVIGIGRLGLCFCLTLENGGYDVVGLDVIDDYVDSINDKSFYSHEPGVNELLSKSTNFLATTDIKKCSHIRWLRVEPQELNSLQEM